MQNVQDHHINEFLDWLGFADLANVANHGGQEEDGAVEEAVDDDGGVAALPIDPVERVEENSDEEDSDEEGSDDEIDDEGIETDCVSRMGESSTLFKNLNVGEVADAIFCTTVSFTKIPTPEKNYLLCQLCYWRYMERCHPLTRHIQATVHRTTDYTAVPRLYCGSCACNLFAISNIATCTQCNNIEKK